jgi:hypothetical protein
MNWIIEHARRKLTFESDSLPSLAGITELYQKLTGDTPVVGLWRKNLAFHLSWKSHPPLPSDQQYSSQSTWSWTSIRHSGRTHLNEDHVKVLFKRPDFSGESEVFWTLKYIRDNIKWKGQPMVSQLEYGILSAKKFLWPDSNLNIPLLEYNNTEIYDFLGRERSRSPTSKIFFPFWMRYCHNGFMDDHWRDRYTIEVHCLILHPCKEDNKTFRRVGLSIQSWRCMRRDKDATVENIVQNLKMIDSIDLI